MGQIAASEPPAYAPFGTPRHFTHCIAPLFGPSGMGRLCACTCTSKNSAQVDPKRLRARIQKAIAIIDEITASPEAFKAWLNTDPVSGWGAIALAVDIQPARPIHFRSSESTILL